MNAPAVAIQHSDEDHARDFILNWLHQASVRAKLTANEIDSIETALRNGFVSVDAAIDWVVELLNQRSLSLFCKTCGCSPCINPRFCAGCRKADAKLLAAPRQSMKKEYEPAASTIDAFHYLLRVGDKLRLQRWFTGRAADEIAYFEKLMEGK